MAGSSEMCVCLCIAVAIVVLVLYTSWSATPPARYTHRRRVRFDPGWDRDWQDVGDVLDSGGSEGMESEPPPTAPAATTLTTEQARALTASSDVNLNPKDAEETERLRESTEAIDHVDVRYRKAQRKDLEDRLSKNVYTKDQRRKIVQMTMSRPQGVRTARSWRRDFGDWIRGDVRPKNLPASVNPDATLHPGALGPLSGLNGAWVSTDSVPTNFFDDGDTLLLSDSTGGRRPPTH